MGVPAPAPGAPRVGFFFWRGGRGGEKELRDQSCVLPSLVHPTARPQGEARGVWGCEEAGDGGAGATEVSAKRGWGFNLRRGEVGFFCGEGGGNPGVHRATAARASARLFIPHRRATTVVPPPPSGFKVTSQGRGHNGTPFVTPPPLKHGGSPHCSLQVPGGHPHPPDGPPRVQFPMGAEGCQGNLQEGHSELCGEGGGCMGVFFGGGGPRAEPDPLPFYFFNSSLPPGAEEGAQLLDQPIQRSQGQRMNPFSLNKTVFFWGVLSSPARTRLFVKASFNYPGRFGGLSSAQER